MKKKVCMTRGDFAKEHRELVRILKSPTKKDDKKEAKKQEKEAKEKLKK